MAQPNSSFGDNKNVLFGGTTSNFNFGGSNPQRSNSFGSSTATGNNRGQDLYGPNPVLTSQFSGFGSFGNQQPTSGVGQQQNTGDRPSNTFQPTFGGPSTTAQSTDPPTGSQQHGQFKFGLGNTGGQTSTGQFLFNRAPTAETGSQSTQANLTTPFNFGGSTSSGMIPGFNTTTQFGNLGGQSNAANATTAVGSSFNFGQGTSDKSVSSGSIFQQPSASSQFGMNKSSLTAAAAPTATAFQTPTTAVGGGTATTQGNYTFGRPSTGPPVSSLDNVVDSRASAKTFTFGSQAGSVSIPASSVVQPQFTFAGQQTAASSLPAGSDAKPGFKFGGPQAASSVPASSEANAGFKFGGPQAASSVPASSEANAGFKFGGPQAASSVPASSEAKPGFAFSGNQQTALPNSSTSATSQGFNFGGVSTAGVSGTTSTVNKPSVGFNVPTASTTNPQSVQIKTGFEATTTTASKPTVSFNIPTDKSVGSLPLNTQAPSGLLFGAAATNTAASTTEKLASTFTFSGNTVATTQTSFGTGFSSQAATTASTATSSINNASQKIDLIGGQAAGVTTSSSSKPTVTFNIPGDKGSGGDTQTTKSFSFGLTSATQGQDQKASATALSGFTLPQKSDAQSVTTSAGKSGFVFGAPSAATSSSAASSALTATTTTGLPTTTTTKALEQSTATSQVQGSEKKLTFKQLDEYVNKWSIELEEQEKVFLKQAAQVNSWDNIIRENQNKIVDLSDYVEHLKADQDRLNSELDFIDTQQRELERLVGPMETAVQQQSSSYGSHLIDKEREQMYTTACELDLRLQQMCHDLTEVIEKVNKSHSGQKKNPMQQVTRILNAHTEALKWVDKNTELLKRKVENAVSQSEIKRNEQEHSLRLAFD